MILDNCGNFGDQKGVWKINVMGSDMLFYLCVLQAFRLFSFSYSLTFPPSGKIFLSAIISLESFWYSSTVFIILKA